MNKKKTILASAYAINPYKGSEDGMGWNFLCQIARFNRVIAVTRKNNREAIEKYMDQHPNPLYNNMKFLYFDLPYWMRFWKKKNRGALLYYWMWQRAIVPFVRRQEMDFDIAHNLNFHNDWTPSSLWKLGKPFVWGPIGHHPLIPYPYLQPYQSSYLIKDRLTWLIKKCFWQLSPALRKTINRATHIWCMNSSVSEVISLPEGRYSIMPSVATEDYGYPSPSKSKAFTLVSAGRLVPLKGFDLSIRAFANFISRIPAYEREKCQLLIVGRGQEQTFLQALARSEGIEQHVKFVPWMDRIDFLSLLRDSAAFLFPSHEGAGMVVAESLSFGLPVICLENCGPGEFIDSTCGFAINGLDYSDTVKKLGGAIERLYREPKLRQDMSRRARERFEHNFHWDRRGDQLQTIYQNLNA